MKTTQLLTAFLLTFIVSANVFAIDLSVFPTSYLGSISNAKASLFNYTTACQISLDVGNGTVTGHSMMTADGIQDSKGFGHYTSPSGKPSFLHYTVPGATPYSCIEKLDLTTSKYAVNKYGVGVAELHWLADPSNPTGCPAQIDQVGWVGSTSGASYVTKFIDSSSLTTIKLPQLGTCMKTGY